MRLKLVQGKQKEIINSLKESRSWRELSKLLEVSEGYLRNELRNEQRLLPEKIYVTTCKILNKDFDKFIIEKMDDHWGQSKGGFISRGKTKVIQVPKESLKLAEFFGIMFGDGNVYRLKGYKLGTYSISIVGDSRHDKFYLTKYVKPLIESLFKIRVGVGKFKQKENYPNSKNAMFIISHSVQLVKFLESKGLKAGNKIKNKLGIPKWIREKPNFLKVYIRGLFDTDGSVYELLPHWPGLYQICLTCHNPILINEVRDGLISLRINCSKISRNKIYITKKSELRKFLKQIGFRNPRHLNKIRNWNL